jgi:GTPase
MKLPVVMIVGRPNVGKSCMFNRIVKARVAVVDDMSGVTRDRNYTEAEWDGTRFLVADTGGVLPPSEDEVAEEIRAQVEMGIEQADAIVFLTDITVGVTDLDLYIANLLRRSAADRVVVAANKSESPSTHYDLGGFMTLGLGEPVAVSALHGRGCPAMLDRMVAICRARPPRTVAAPQQSLKLAILGRPNAGKSSLVNRLLGVPRMIVHDQPGTTRDAVDSHLTWHGKSITLIDTAGLRKKSHVRNRVEYHGNLRSLGSIERADICVLLVDASLGVSEQDIRILRQIDKVRRGVILCLNKWDLVEKDHRTFDLTAKELRRHYMQLKHVPIISVSALSGQRVISVIQTAAEIEKRMQQHVPASDVRRAITTWALQNPHPFVSGKPVKIMGGTQVAARSPTFVVFAANHELVRPSYERFLVNNIQDKWDFFGCPVNVLFRAPSAPVKKHSRRDGGRKESAGARRR